MKHHEILGNWTMARIAPIHIVDLRNPVGPIIIERISTTQITPSLSCRTLGLSQFFCQHKRQNKGLSFSWNVIWLLMNCDEVMGDEKIVIPATIIFFAFTEAQSEIPPDSAEYL
jgi:hypothetical protein